MSVCRPRFCEFREILIHFLLQPLAYQLGQYMTVFHTFVRAEGVTTSLTLLQLRKPLDYKGLEIHYRNTNKWLGKDKFQGYM